MLNPFPQLLVFGFFAPTLLRVAVALVLFCVAYGINANRRGVCATSFPLVGKPRPWMVRISAAITILVGLSLLCGWDTQWAAILGMIIAFKHGVLAHRYPTVVPISRTAYILLFVICLSLLLTGAGALAMDVPL